MYENDTNIFNKIFIKEYVYCEIYKLVIVYEQLENNLTKITEIPMFLHVNHIFLCIYIFNIYFKEIQKNLKMFKSGKIVV